MGMWQFSASGQFWGWDLMWFSSMRFGGCALERRGEEIADTKDTKKCLLGEENIIWRQNWGWGCWYFLGWLFILLFNNLMF